MLRAIAATAAIAMLLAAEPASAEKALAIKSIEARLFYNYSGTLSKPVTGKTVLWNAVIGEGNLDEPSNSTLVDVTVEGEPGSFEPDLRVELVVSDASSGQVVLRQSGEIGVLNASGTYHTGFWLPKPGCQPLRVRARIVGTKASKVISIPFSCGE